MENSESNPDSLKVLSPLDFRLRCRK